VDEYWKGSADRTHILYGVDDGTDYTGDGGYEAGKNYLVYAGEQIVKDEALDGFFGLAGRTRSPKEHTCKCQPRAHPVVKRA
jgi:hypothetical protein